MCVCVWVCHGMSMSIFMSICISVAMTHITGFSSKPSPFLTVGSFFRVSSEFRTQVAIPMTSKKRMTAKPIVPPERRSNRDGSLMIFVFPQKVFGQQEFITLHCDVCWRVKKGDLAPLLELKAAQCSAQKFNAPDTGQF